MEDKVKKIIADMLGYELEEVTNEATLKTLGADCLDEVEILMELEKEFDIRIDDDYFELCKDVSDIIELVNRYI